MTTSAQLNHAVGCLSTVFPQFVAKELATLIDGIMSGVQGFSDPLAAISDLQLDSLIGNVAALSEGDVFKNLDLVAAGLATQFVSRELEETMATRSEEFTTTTKRVHQVRNLGERALSTIHAAMGLYADMPFAAAQHMCKIIISMVELKNANLDCMRKHIVQLSNSIAVLAKNVETYKDTTLANLDTISALLEVAIAETTASQRTIGGGLVFDASAFERARDVLVEISLLMAPPQTTTSIMDVANILTFGSISTAHVEHENVMLVHVAIPSLIMLIEAEMSASASQSDLINHMVSALGQLLESFRGAANTSKVQTQRFRVISEIHRRLDDLRGRVDVARRRKSVKAASAEMLLWSSRVKSMIAMIDQVKQLAFVEGSVEDVGQTAVIQAGFDALLAELGSISSDNGSTAGGIEDMTLLRSKVYALTKGAQRYQEDLDAGRSSPSKSETFHALVAQTSGDQVSAIEESIIVANAQKAACQRFLEYQIDGSENYAQILDTMRQLNFDRGVDLLSSGSFTAFLDSSPEVLSYLGTVIKCLTETINGLDDVQTRQQIMGMRDGLVAKRTNQEVASADSSDKGLTRFIENLQQQMTDIQKNAKTVEAILDDLKKLGAQLQIDLSAAGAGMNAFAANRDRLAVGAGGRLASGLEEFSKHPKAGVPLCEAP